MISWPDGLPQIEALGQIGHACDWKLVGRMRDTTDGHQPLKVSLFLATLKGDPGERTKLAGQHPEIVTRQRILHDQAP